MQATEIRLKNISLSDADTWKTGWESAHQGRWDSLTGGGWGQMEVLGL